MQGNFFTYLILTENNTLYCGYTNDLDKRFENHCNGKASKYTRANKPVKIAYYEIHSTKSEAMKAEARIKKLNRCQKLQLIESMENNNDKADN